MESSAKWIVPGVLLDGRYRLVRYIDGGGMGKVYEAADTRLADKPVAIKLLITNLAAEGELLEHLKRRFEQEAQLCALLGCQGGITQVSDYGVSTGQPYLVMEYLVGQSLKELIRTEGAIAPERTVRLATQICESLHYAHHLRTHLGGRQIFGVVHRDVKPSNLFVLPRGRQGEVTKVLDFGVAKALSDVSLALGTSVGFVGTCDYASPEQLRGEELDGRSDIYSLGVVLYQMLTGRLPLQPRTSSFAGWYQAHNHETPTDLGRLPLGEPVPAMLAATVMACLEKDPARRPASMRELGERLQDSLLTATVVEAVRPGVSVPASAEIATGSLQVAQPLVTPPAVQKARSLDRGLPSKVTTWAASRPTLLGVGGAIGLALLGGVVYFQAGPRPPQTPLEANEPGPIAQPVVQAAAQPKRPTTPRKPDGPRVAFKPASSLAAHEGGVHALAYLADGRVLASAGADRTVRLWNPADGTLWRSLNGHADSVLTLALGHNRPLAASGGSDKTVRLWDRTTGELLHTLTGHTDAVRAVAIFSDDAVVVSGAADGTIRLWSTTTGELLRTLEDPDQGAVNALAVSPGGRLLVSGSDDGTAKIWQRDTGSLVRQLVGHTGYVLAVAASPDGRYVATGSDDRTVRLWKPGTGRLLRVLGGHVRPVRTLAFSADSRLLATGSDDRTVNVYEAATGRLLQTLTTGRPVSALVFAPDGKSIGIGTDDSQIAVFVQVGPDPPTPDSSTSSGIPSP